MVGNQWVYYISDVEVESLHTTGEPAFSASNSPNCHCLVRRRAAFAFQELLISACRAGGQDITGKHSELVPEDDAGRGFNLCG